MAAVTPASRSDHIARSVAPLFSSLVVLELARTGRSGLLSGVLRETSWPKSPRGMSYGAFFDACHAELWSHYRSEYVYKNAIATKILLGRHSVRSTRFFSEFRVDSCKADVVLINGTSTCYEIKTELDGLDRLASQLDAYSRVFDRIHVVTFAACADKLLEILPRHVGVLVLTDAYTFRVRREAISNREQVSPSSIFDSLRQTEYVNILRHTFGRVPDVPNTRMYRECREMFCELPPDVAHDWMVRELKNRETSPELVELVEGAVPSLKAALLAAPLRPRDATNLTSLLERELIV